MPRRLLFVLAAITVASFSNKTARAQDEVRFLNGKKQEERLQVTIKEESPAGIVYKLSSGRTEKLAARDIIDIVYQVPQGLRLDYRGLGGKEREADQVGTKADKRLKLLQEAQKQYQELIPKLGDAKFAQRHAQFKGAILLARLAEDDPTLREAAAEALTKFKADHADGWQLLACAKQLAALKERMGDTAAVKKLYEELAAKPELDKETRQEFGLLEARMLLRTNQAADAKTKLQQLGKDLPAQDSRSVRLQVYLAACDASAGVSKETEKQLTSIISGGSDNDVKALACNTLADAQLKDGKLEEAFWLYLYVDVLYPQDREEHAKALYHLAKLFEQVKKDPTRAQQCLERLATDKEFLGLDLQKTAQKEKKPAP
ncbi:MAG: hypothetical protein ACJ8FY_15260 [Gemmataceae bacterium]